MNPLDATGLSSTPLFLTYQPFKIDTSAVDRTQELRAKLLFDLSERDKQAKEAIKDLALPNVTELPNDTRKVVERASSAKRAMVKMLAENPNMHAYQVMQMPEFSELKRQYEAASSPDVLASLKQRKSQYDMAVEAANVKSKQGDPITNQFIVRDGNFMNLGGIPLTVSQGLQFLSQETEGDYEGALGKENISELTSVITPLGLDDYFRSVFKGVGESSNQYRGFLSDEQASKLNPEQSAYYYMTRSGGGSSNVSQLNTALNNLLEKMTPEQERAIVQGYMDTGNVDLSDKKFYDENGQISYQRIKNSAFADKTISKGKNKLTYAQAFLMNTMREQIKTSSVSEIGISGAKPNRPTGGDGTEASRATWSNLATAPVMPVTRNAQGNVEVDPNTSKGTVVGIPMRVGQNVEGGRTLTLQNLGSANSLSRNLSPMLFGTRENPGVSGYNQEIPESAKAEGAVTMPGSAFEHLVSVIDGTSLPIEGADIVAIKGGLGVGPVLQAAPRGLRGGALDYNDRVQEGEGTIDQKDLTLEGYVRYKKEDAAKIIVRTPDVDETGKKIVKTETELLTDQEGKLLMTIAAPGFGYSRPISRTKNITKYTNPSLYEGGRFKTKETNLAALAEEIDDPNLIQEDGNFVYVKTVVVPNQQGMFSVDAASRNVNEFTPGAGIPWLTPDYTGNQNQRIFGNNTIPPGR